MKDIVTPVPPEEVKGVIRKCLEQAAQLNYQRIQEYAKIEGNQETEWLFDWMRRCSSACKHKGQYKCFWFQSEMQWLDLS